MSTTVTSGAPVVGTTVVTTASAARRAHLDVQLAAVAALGHRRVVVWLDEGAAPDLPADVVLAVPPGPRGLRLAAARNAGADRAVADGADLVVFLDADCVPDTELVTRYADAARERPDAVLCGPVTYLPEGVEAGDAGVMRRHRAPHAARPDPAPGILRVASPDEYPLFWSLSFAVTATRWRQGPRFDEAYEGYGGEDTDYAFRLREGGVPLVWVGGADAYHQYHPTSSPPRAHLDDILRNGALFAERWHEWPMLGWLEAFEREGLVRRDGDSWTRAAAPRGR
ncbi:Chondroitin synthase [Frondihabitans sp. 762G35]|uniref:glycosyltransferase family 2 protein n=1 Tax=Frondihabitans sp. 762G35 TaxID=1446794 RepID=UPI000D20B642|nr:glycosyltransferase [Frondihabitans sp. 762G35]ARC58544.1 Chondroitin synthase [Frondihabitans sp. 762G35]